MPGCGPATADIEICTTCSAADLACEILRFIFSRVECSRRGWTEAVHVKKMVEVSGTYFSARGSSRHTWLCVLDNRFARPKRTERAKRTRGTEGTGPKDQAGQRFGEIEKYLATINPLHPLRQISLSSVAGQPFRKSNGVLPVSLRGVCRQYVS